MKTMKPTKTAAALFVVYAASALLPISAGVAMVLGAWLGATVCLLCTLFVAYVHATTEAKAEELYTRHADIYEQLIDVKDDRLAELEAELTKMRLKLREYAAREERTAKALDELTKSYDEVTASYHQMAKASIDLISDLEALAEDNNLTDDLCTRNN